MIRRRLSSLNGSRDFSFGKNPYIEPTVKILDDNFWEEIQIRKCSDDRLFQIGFSKNSPCSKKVRDKVRKALLLRRYMALICS